MDNCKGKNGGLGLSQLDVKIYIYVQYRKNTARIKKL